MSARRVGPSSVAGAALLALLPSCRGAGASAADRTVVVTELPADAAFEDLAPRGSIAIDDRVHGGRAVLEYGTDDERVEFTLFPVGGGSVRLETAFDGDGVARALLGGPPDVDAWLRRGDDGRLSLHLVVR